MQWKCPKCETINQGANCQICGEPKRDEYIEQQEPHVIERQEVEACNQQDLPPTYNAWEPDESREYRDYSEPSRGESGSTSILLKLLFIILALALMAAFFAATANTERVGDGGDNAYSIESPYDEANRLKNEGNYSDAQRIFEENGYQSDANECGILYAQQLIDEGNYSTARDVLYGLQGWGVDDQIDPLFDQCTLLEARDMMSCGSYSAAYDSYQSVIHLPEAAEEIKTTYPHLYEEALRLYRTKDYYGAMNYFGKVGDYSDAPKYYKLADASCNGITNVYDLYDLIHMEGAKEILLSDNVIHHFMEGKWVSGNSYIEYYKNTEEEGRWRSQWNNLPINYDTEREYYSLHNASHWFKYVGREEEVCEWKYTIVDWNTISVYICKTGRTITMRRQ